MLINTTKADHTLLADDPLEGELPAPATANVDGQSKSILHTSAHPIALVFFLLFRTVALLAYLLGVFFTSNLYVK